MQQRFSVAAVLIVLLTAGAAVLPATRGDIRSVLPGDGMRRLQTPQRCAAFVSSAFGNPLTNAVLAALAAVELALVWPLLAAEAKRPMHEHLQRFVWVDADLAEAKAARDRGALPHDTSQVRPSATRECIAQCMRCMHICLHACVHFRRAGYT